MDLSISCYVNSNFICHFLLYEKNKKIISLFLKTRNRNFLSQEVWQVYIKPENSWRNAAFSSIWFSTDHIQKQTKSKRLLSYVQTILHLARRKRIVICFCHVIPLGDKNKSWWNVKENAPKICAYVLFEDHWIVSVSCNEVVPMYKTNKKGLLK